MPLVTFVNQVFWTEESVFRSTLLPFVGIKGPLNEQSEPTKEIPRSENWYLHKTILMVLPDLLFYGGILEKVIWRIK